MAARSPAQFSSLSDFTDELMALSESLKRRAEGLATREAALDARERDFEETCARMQQGKDSYVVELEQELEANAWISIEPDHELIFLSENEPAWKQAIAKLGIDPGQLASVGGHA